MIGVRLDDILEENDKYGELMEVVKDPFHRHAPPGEPISSSGPQGSHRSP